MKRTGRKSDCPINYGLEIFGDRWAFLIVRDLMFKGKHYYNEFLQSEEKIATNILANRLSTLENNGIIIKQDDPEHGAKYIYRLSKKGIELLPVLVEIIMWSARHDAQSAVDMHFVKEVKKDKQAVIKKISSRLIKELAAG